MGITTQHGHRPTFAELFTPKLVTVTREGYGFVDFRADLIAGLTVAIVALPLSMAIAIASGVTPDRGLYAADDKADHGNGDRKPFDAGLASDPDVVVYRISGAFFFGAASTVGTVLDSLADTHKAFVVDFAAVPFLDSTAANAMSRVAAKAQRQGIKLFITGASSPVRRALLTHGVRPPRAKFRETIARAVADIKGDGPAQPVAKDGLAAG